MACVDSAPLCLAEGSRCVCVLYISRLGSCTRPLIPVSHGCISCASRAVCLCRKPCAAHSFSRTPSQQGHRAVSPGSVHTSTFAHCIGLIPCPWYVCLYLSTRLGMSLGRGFEGRDLDGRSTPCVLPHAACSVVTLCGSSTRLSVCVCVQSLKGL